MLVVSDSSPINFLVQMGLEHLLPSLFTSVAIPGKVAEELNRPSTPQIVKDFIRERPAWLHVQDPFQSPEDRTLDPGEAAAIGLALELNADALLIDDNDARKFARRSGIRVIGLLGVLEQADVMGLIVLPEVAQLLPAEYRIDPSLVVRAVFDSQSRRNSRPNP